MSQTTMAAFLSDRDRWQALVDRDPSFKKIETETGPLTVRTWAVGFPSLVRIILGQQLSSRAAQAIFRRLKAQMELSPGAIAAAPDLTLQQVGFSRAKIATCQRRSPTYSGTTTAS